MKKEQIGDWEENERKDHNRNGLDDATEPPIPNVEAGSEQLAERFRSNPGTDPSLSGGDVDARWEDAESGGEETVGGSMATPGQNDVGEMGRAMGVTYADDEELKIGEKERSRDQHRWELDPASSEDYVERSKTKE